TEADLSATVEVGRESPASSGEKCRPFFEAYRVLAGLMAKIRGLVRVPLLAGFRKRVIARREVRSGLSDPDFGSFQSPGRDFLAADDIPSVATTGRCDRVLARIDQDGFAFALDSRDQSLFPGR